MRTLEQITNDLRDFLASRIVEGDYKMVSVSDCNAYTIEHDDIRFSVFVRPWEKGKPILFNCPLTYDNVYIPQDKRDGAIKKLFEKALQHRIEVEDAERNEKYEAIRQEMEEMELNLKSI